MELATCSTVQPQYCKVCGQIAHGNHFGVLTCRACAAFFRRSARVPESMYRCGNNSKCGVLVNGRFACKKCKLQKCLEVGMDPRKFIFGRDLITSMEDYTKQIRKPQFLDNLPETIELLTGKSSFVIFMDPQPLSLSKKSFINLQPLINEGVNILELGPETPLFAENQLKKLANGLKILQQKSQNTGVKKVTKIGQTEAIQFWETDFLAAAKWLTYFDGFQNLPRVMQITLLKSVWHVRTRLEKLALTATCRRNQICQKSEMMLGKSVAFDQVEVEMDISWITKYPKEKLKFLFEEPHNWMDTSIIDPLVALQSSEIELTYMMCQLCFQYAGKRHQGEILEATERLQTILANDLHNYYTKDLKLTNYSGRLSQMMKINNRIQQDIREKRIKNELAETFQIYCAEFSHPELFLDV